VAKLAELIDCLTAVLGIPRTTLEAYVKPLRKAGLLSSAGRSGPGAPDMTATDAVNLLLAVLGGSALRATENVENYRNLVFFAPPGLKGGRLDGALTYLALEKDHTFGEVLEGLIRADNNRPAEGMLRDWVALEAAGAAGRPFDLSTGGGTHLRQAIDERYATYTRVQITEPRLAAAIEIGAIDRATRVIELRLIADYAPRRVVDNPACDWEKDGLDAGDLTVQRIVGSATLDALAQMLGGEPRGFGRALRRQRR